MSAAEVATGRTEPRPALARARTGLSAAGLLAAQGFPGEAIEIAFRAATVAAQAALAALDESRNQPSDVVSAYVRRVVRERAMDPDTGRALRALLNRAALAERSWAPVPAAEAASSLADATDVVEAVAAWLDDSARSGPRAGGATRLPARNVKRRKASGT